jgi:hypothetical protein
MTFAAPLFLIAALAAAIPIVLHMVNRQRAKQLPFPTLRFLKISVQKTRRRKRVHDILLMLLRAAVLLLLAVGLARPAITSLGALWGSSSTAAVIILDNSASMGMIDGDRPRFERATGAAVQILDQLVDGDQVALLPTCGPAFPDAGQLARSQAAVRLMLGECRVSHERANLPQKLQQAHELLAKSEAANKQIYVISDMQRASWEEGRGTRDGGRGTGENPGLGTSVPSNAATEGGRRTGEGGEQESKSPNPQIPKSPNPSSPFPIILINCNHTPKPNCAVQRVDVEAAIPVTDMPIKASVTLLNTATVAQQRTVELLIDGVQQSTSPELSLPPLGRAKHDFTFSLARGGLHRGEVRLVGEDGSKYDDRRMFAIQVDQGIPVAIVKSRRHEIAYLDDAYYLEKALAAGRSGGGAIVATTLLAGDLATESLQKFKVVFCVNLPALDAQAADRLAEYVADGGRVVWICGDNVRPEAYNSMNQQVQGRLLPAPLVDIRTPDPKGNRDSWHIAFLDKKCPALGRLVEPASLYESVLVYKHVGMAPADAAASILARLDDGQPLLVQRNVSVGRVLMLGTSTQPAWSNLPLRPIFLPLITQLTFELAEIEQAQTDLLAGQPLVLRSAGVPPATEEAGGTPALPAKGAGTAAPQGFVEVIPPGGEVLRLKASSQEFRYDDTHQIGVYLLRLPEAVPPRQIACSVNFDPDEAEPAVVERSELEERFGRERLVFADNPDDLSGTFAWLREGKSLSGLFLTVVLFALVFETFLSNRFSPKQEEPDVQGPRRK